MFKNRLFITTFFVPFFIVGMHSLHSQPSWTGIIAPDRAIDWSTAGVAGGIPNRTTISATLNPGATIAQINSAITSCPSGQIVYLNTGTYNLGSGLILLKSNVTLRGAGADKTKLYFTGRGSNNGISCVIGMPGSYINGGYNSTPQNSANWTSGYTKGSTVLTFSTTANLVVGDLVILEQDNDAADSGCYVCGTAGVCSYTNGGGDVWGGRFQRQLATAAAINGNQVTIAQPLYMPNWRASQNPKARWAGYRPGSNMGLENLSVDISAIGNPTGQNTTISLLGCTNCWIKGVRTIGADRSFLNIYMACYGIETYGASGDLLIENNIVQHNTAPFNVNDGGANIVFGYNFTIDNMRAPDNLQSSSFWIHSPGTGMVLYEGNSALGFTHDNWYGTTNFITFFRNHFYGDIYNNPVKTSHTSPMLFAAFSRFYNCVGNVLGRSGYYTTYEPSGTIGEDSRNIWCFGFSFAYNPGKEVTDVKTKTTLFRWGNYETVTGTVRFEPGEVPSALPQFANPVPATPTLPKSFYLSRKPGFFGNMVWPPVGPDVTGGDVLGYAGHAYKIPARLCWENSPIDAAFGSRNVRVFAPDNFYNTGIQGEPLISSAILKHVNNSYAVYNIKGQKVGVMTDKEIRNGIQAKLFTTGLYLVVGGEGREQVVKKIAVMR
jgi:hypothetical protein